MNNLKSIPHFEGKYKVDEKGNVYSLHKGIDRSKPLGVTHGKVRLTINKKHYLIPQNDLIRAAHGDGIISYNKPSPNKHDKCCLKSKIELLESIFIESNIIKKIELLSKINFLKHRLSAQKQLKSKKKLFWSNSNHKINLSPSGYNKLTTD